VFVDNDEVQTCVIELQQVKWQEIVKSAWPDGRKGIACDGGPEATSHDEFAMELIDAASHVR
jgi:hypothetical protein